MQEALCGTKLRDLHLERADLHGAVVPCNTKQTQTGSFFQIHRLVKGSMLLTSLPAGSCREDAAGCFFQPCAGWPRLTQVCYIQSWSVLV